MGSKLERIEKNEVALEIEVPGDKVSEALNKAYRRVVKDVSVPGFRKGRVPRPVLESYFGKEILYEEALNELLPVAYEEAVKENDLTPVTEPQIDVVQMEEGKPLVFKARVVVKPEVVLGQVEGIEVTTSPITVTEEDVDKRLEAMRERYARLVKVQDDVTAQEGDVLRIDFEGFIDGEPFPGGKGEDYSLELGSRTFIPGFEEQLVGTKTGEEKEIKVQFPEDYHSQDLAGKEAMFKVNVHEIKRRELSPLNDEFAQEVSEFETLEELREEIRKNLTKMAEERTKQLRRDEVVAKAVESAEVDIHPAMIEEQIDSMLESFQQRLAQQGLTLEDYINVTGTSLEAIRDDYAQEAEKTLRANLVLEKIALEKGLKPTEEDFRQHLQRVAGDFGIDADQLKERVAGSRGKIEYGIMLDKAVDFLLENAVTVQSSGWEEENRTDAE